MIGSFQLNVHLVLNYQSFTQIKKLPVQIISMKSIDNPEKGVIALTATVSQELQKVYRSRTTIAAGSPP